MADVKITTEIEGLELISRQLRDLNNEFRSFATTVQESSRKSAAATKEIQEDLRGAVTSGTAIGQLISQATIGLKNYFVSAVQETVAYGRQVKDIAESIGLTLQKTSQLAVASELSGGGIGRLIPMMTQFNQQLLAAREGSEQARRGWERLKLDPKIFDSPQEALDAVLKKLADMPAGAQRAQAATELFGRRMGNQMIQLAQDMERAREVMNAFGLDMSGTAPALEEFGKRMTEIQLAFKGARVAIAESFLPILTDLSADLIRSGKDGETMSDGIMVAVEALKLMGQAIVAVIGGIALLGRAIGGMYAQIEQLEQVRQNFWKNLLSPGGGTKGLNELLGGDPKVMADQAKEFYTSLAEDAKKYLKVIEQIGQVAPKVAPAKKTFGNLAEFQSQSDENKPALAGDFASNINRGAKSDPLSALKSLRDNLQREYTGMFKDLTDNPKVEQVTLQLTQMFEKMKVPPALKGQVEQLKKEILTLAEAEDTHKKKLEEEKEAMDRLTQSVLANIAASEQEVAMNEARRISRESFLNALKREADAYAGTSEGSRKAHAAEAYQRQQAEMMARFRVETEDFTRMTEEDLANLTKVQKKYADDYKKTFKSIEEGTDDSLRDVVNAVKGFSNEVLDTMTDMVMGVEGAGDDLWKTLQRMFAKTALDILIVQPMQEAMIKVIKIVREAIKELSGEGGDSSFGGILKAILGALMKAVGGSGGGASQSLGGLGGVFENTAAFEAFDLSAGTFAADAGALAGSSMVADAAGALVFALHEGGVAGESGTPRVVPVTAFENAKRYHQGLAADEVPAILQRGEEVKSRKQVAAGDRGDTYNFNYAFSAGVTRAEMMSIIPQIRAQTIAGVMEAKRRGGKFSASF